MSVSIKYKGVEIASADTDVTKTIKTRGEYCEDDIIVENTPDGGTGGNYNIESVDDGNGGQILNITDAHGGIEITLGMVCTDFSRGDRKPTKADLYCEGEIPYGMFALSYGFATAQAGDLTFHGKPTKLNAYAFYRVSDCYGLDTSKINNLPAYCFAATNWRSRANIEFSEATSVSGTAQFYEASGIVNIAFPKLNTLPSNFIGRVTSMQVCQVGSIGHPVTSSHSGCFIGDTQNGLTITAFCEGAYANTLLANIRNGATNATIIIKASENTTYGGASYAAGDTMITSEVA